MVHYTSCPMYGTRFFADFLELFFMSEEGVKPKSEKPSRTPRKFAVVSENEDQDRGDNKGIMRNVSGPKIKDRRLQLQWTQQRLADEIADASKGEWIPTQPDVRRVEGQRRILADRDLIHVTIALRCTAAWLLNEATAPEPEFPLTEPTSNKESS